MTTHGSAKLLSSALLAACLLALEPASPLVAQQRPVSAEPRFGGTVMFGLELGGAAFTDFQRALARPAAQPDAAGKDTGVGDFRRRVSARTTATVGASVAVWPRAGWGVRAGASWSPTRFSVWNEEQARRMLEEHGTVPEKYAGLNSWTAHATAVFRLPFTLGRVVPYGLAGAGVVRYALSDEEEVPPEARARFSGGDWTGGALVFGVGSAVPLQRFDLLLNFELTNHMSRTPLNDEGLGEGFQIAGVPLGLAADPGRGNDGIGLAHQLRLTAGITLPVRISRGN
jgi:opacity protein-like surface antigen